MKSLKDTPAGVLDDYSEWIRERRAKEVDEYAKQGYCRPVKHVAQVMAEYIQDHQDRMKKQK